MTYYVIVDNIYSREFAFEEEYDDLAQAIESAQRWNDQEHLYAHIEDEEGERIYD